MTEGRVENIYDMLKQMAVNFRIRPGDRLSEVAFSRELGVSRTPLRTPARGTRHFMSGWRK